MALLTVKALQRVLIELKDAGATARQESDENGNLRVCIPSKKSAYPYLVRHYVVDGEHLMARNTDRELFLAVSPEEIAKLWEYVVEVFPEAAI